VFHDVEPFWEMDSLTTKDSMFRRQQNYPEIDGGNMEVMKNNKFIFTPKVGVY
jgi:hypothetical protein